MTWQVKRDGYRAEWIDEGSMAPFIRVTGPGINAPYGLEFDAATPTLDVCDLMHCCITYAQAVSHGQPVRQTLTIIRGSKRHG